MKTQKAETTKLMKFLIPSLIGVLLFLVPFPIGGEPTLIINLIINTTKDILGTALIPIVIIILFITAICSLIGHFKPSCFKGMWANFFNAKLSDCIIRVVAAIISVAIYFKIGPEFIWSSATGGMMMSDVVANLVPFFFWCGIAMPLLTEFGMMEFIGNLMRPVMRPLYKVPGRSAVNAAVAWVGSGTMGIILTDQEYRAGYYTKKESVIISTGFAIPSIAIVSLLCSFLDLSNIFPQIYVVSIMIGLIAQFILVRIPPIKGKSNDYCPTAEKRDVSEKTPEGYSTFTYAVKCAADRASLPHGNLLYNGLKVALDVWFTLLPIVLGLGTAATIICEYTPVMKYLSMPLAWLMQLLGIAESTIAAQSILLGFIDVFLPFIAGASITSVATKFIVAVVCILQIIFISETGPLLMKVDFDLSFWDILIIFLMRTVVVLLLVLPFTFILF